MTKITGMARRPWLGTEGRVKKGDRFGEGEKFAPLDERRAKILVDQGLFLPDLGKEAAKKASGRPSKGSRRGGQTGEGKQSSSSPAAQVSKTSRSTKSKGDPE